MALIPDQNPASLWSYYLGILALIPALGLLLGPAAVAFGIVAIRAANERPEVEGKGHAIVGLVLGGLSTLGHFGVVILVVVGLANG